MKPELIARLLSLNRQFYFDFAEPFAATRTPRQPGLERILPYFPKFCTLLDVGCGNGRLALWLEQKSRRLNYLGVDSSPALLAHARSQTATLQHVAAMYMMTDVIRPGWHGLFGLKRFSVITLLAVLHHIPGREQRKQLLQELAALLSPGGVLILTTWQFLSSPRLRRKIVPWERVGIPAGEVEAGDFLLDWRQGGIGYRYCHFVDEAELSELAWGAGLILKETFYADGKEGNLNLYGVLRRRGSGA